MGSGNPDLKIRSARKCRHIFDGGGGVLFKLRNDVEPEDRRHVHQQRVAQQEFERLGLRVLFTFISVGIGVSGTSKSHLQKFGHQKHEGDDATHNISVVVHSVVLLKYILTKTNHFVLFTNCNQLNIYCIGIDCIGIYCIGIYCIGD